VSRMYGQSQAKRPERLSIPAKHDKPARGGISPGESEKAMYNVELYDKTARKVIASQGVTNEAKAADIARGYIERAKQTGQVIQESNYQLSPRCFIFGQTITTSAGTFEISTGKTI